MKNKVLIDPEKGFVYFRVDDPITVCGWFSATDQRLVDDADIEGGRCLHPLDMFDLSGLVPAKVEKVPGGAVGSFPDNLQQYTGNPTFILATRFSPSHGVRTRYLTSFLSYIGFSGGTTDADRYWITDTGVPVCQADIIPSSVIEVRFTPILT